jgi:small-conductance mechanosensitive channel
MITEFLGLDVLISSWIIAHLLAIISVFFLRQTSIFDSIVLWLEKITPHKFVYRNSRWFTYLFIVAALGALLTILMILIPLQSGIVPMIVEYFQADSMGSNESSSLDKLMVTVGILFLLSFVPFINRSYTKVCQTIRDWRHTHFQVIKFYNLELFTPNQLSNLLILTTKYVRLSIIFLVAAVCITLVFSLFPLTQNLAQALIAMVSGNLRAIWKRFLELLPNLITLIAIVALTRGAINVLRFFRDGLQQGRIKFSGIHPELVEPTYQLLRLLAIALALVAAFPYIPGSSSPVFRGISIFIGFLISLGSTSLVTNLISGVVLTYSRGLKIGDRVQIGDCEGDVIDRTLLVTRIKTIKNVVITIPNGKVMQNQIINYSAKAQEGGLILHTSITIGYDVPWRRVQGLLIDAAQETSYVMKSPRPFVLKTSLDDSYISYELNAYTTNASKMVDIYSELHQNILDKFNQDGVEIMSPTFFAFRNGKKSTIPSIEYSDNGKGKSSGTYNRRKSHSGFREKTQPLGTS